MADLSDVEQTIANAVASTLYPFGSSQLSVIGATCRIYRGWPNSATLNTDLSNGTVNVTIMTDNDSGRTTTRFLPEWQTTPSQPGIMVSAVGQTITISGNPAAGDVMGLLIDRAVYAYRLQTGDTLDMVASNINRLIQVNRAAIARGPTITIPGADSIEIRIVCDGATSFESRRQEKDLRIVCWCPTPLIRDAAAAAIDAAMAQVGFLTLSDNTSARVVYKNTSSYDQAQNALLYRRDLVYTVEYPTVTIFNQPSMLFGASDINSNITYG